MEELESVRESVERLAKIVYMPIPAEDVLRELIDEFGASMLIEIIKYLDDVREY